MSNFAFGFLIGVISGILLWEHWNKNNLIVQNKIDKIKGDGNTTQQELFPVLKPVKEKKGFLWGIFRRKKQ